MTTEKDTHYEHQSGGGYFATLLALLIGTLLLRGITPAGFRLPASCP